MALQFCTLQIDKSTQLSVERRNSPIFYLSKTEFHQISVRSAMLITKVRFELLSIVVIRRGLRLEVRGLLSLQLNSIQIKYYVIETSQLEECKVKKV